MSTFIDRLIQASRKAGVGDSQSAIASALGLSRQQVHKWFKHGSEPESDVLLKISELWGVNPGWLKYGTGDMIQSAARQADLSPEERELVLNYREAPPRMRSPILEMARTLKKAGVAVIFGLPALLGAPSEGNAGQFNITTDSLHIGQKRRRMIAASHA